MENSPQRCAALRIARWVIAAVLLLGVLLHVPNAGALAPNDPASAATDSSTRSLTYADAVLLGVVEGVTEYLPVSSTGHLLVTGRLRGLDGTDAFDSYAIAIQAGAILAVLALYRRRVTSVLAGLVGRDAEGLRLGLNLLVAFVPAAVIGLLLEGPIKDRLFSPWAIGAAWLAGGGVILAFERRRSGGRGGRLGLDGLTWRSAFVVGCCQAFALWPGTSRSLVTILAALAVGLEVAAAVELSFLLGLITLGAATAYETLGNASTMLDAYGSGRPLVGLLAALVSALVAVRWMVGRLKNHGLAVFGWYRIAVAVVMFALLGAGAL